MLYLTRTLDEVERKEENAILLPPAATNVVLDVVETVSITTLLTCNTEPAGKSASTSDSLPREGILINAIFSS
jgi:hypothetical protein